MNDLPVISAEEARVLGSLIEKQITTPEYYPLTVNSLVAACNQKNNRDPVVAYDEATVVYALDRLRDHGLACSVNEAGARVIKYRHTLTAVIHVEGGEVAVLCELLLRGPQTGGELRSRAARMFPYTDLGQVQEVLENLSTYPDGTLVTRLQRSPGTKEFRYAHLLCGPVPAAWAEERAATGEPARRAVPVDESRVARLEEEVSALRAQVEELTRVLEDFRRQFE
jgi:uncharacterized protein